MCRAGYVAVWVQNIEERFRWIEEWCPESGRPTSWHALGNAVGRDPKGFTQYPHFRDALETGIRKPRLPDTVLRYRVSWALGCAEHELSPDTPQWIASATRFLLLLFDSKALEHMSDQWLLAYSQYVCLHYGEHDGFLDAKAIATVLEVIPRLGRDERVEEAVLATAAAVGSVLLNRFFHGRQ